MSAIKDDSNLFIVSGSQTLKAATELIQLALGNIHFSWEKLEISWSSSAVTAWWHVDIQNTKAQHASLFSPIYYSPEIMPSSDEETQQSQFFKTLFHVFFFWYFMARSSSRDCQKENSYVSGTVSREKWSEMLMLLGSCLLKCRVVGDAWHLSHY